MCGQAGSDGKSRLDAKIENAGAKTMTPPFDRTAWLGRVANYLFNR